MTPLGMALAGPVAETFGIRAWFFAASAVSVVIGPLALLSRSIMNLDKPEAAPDPSVDSPSAAQGAEVYAQAE